MSCFQPSGACAIGTIVPSHHTRPDGTAVDIGPDFGGCTELATRVNAYSQLCDGNGSTAPCTYHP